MKRTSTLFLATLLTAAACGGKPAEQSKNKEASADKTKEKVAADTKKKEPPKKDEAKPAEAKPAQPEGALAKTGIEIGGKMEAFDIINCDSGKTYCQVCEYGSSPKVMAVGSPDDAEFKKDLAALQELVNKLGEEKVKAFAVVTEKKDGQFLPPPTAEADAMKAKAKAIKDELKLAMPVVVPAAETKGEKNTTFIKHYQVKESRTIVFANGDNEVKYSAVGPADLKELEKVITESVG